MELWDLYDENRVCLNRHQVRGEDMVEGEYHIVVSIWTINTKGQILTTLRDPNKDAYPDVWENTAGSILKGEMSRQGAVRELFEETGIKVSEDELVLIEEKREASAFVDLYIVCKDVAIDELTMQEGETVDAKWVSLETFESMIAHHVVAEPVARRYKLIKDKIKAELEKVKNS